MSVLLTETIIVTDDEKRKRYELVTARNTAKPVIGAVLVLALLFEHSPSHSPSSESTGRAI